MTNSSPAGQPQPVQHVQSGATERPKATHPAKGVRRSRPVSVMNRVLFALLLVVAVVAAVRGLVGLAVVVMLGVALSAVSVQRARQGRGSVNERISALQPYDERDRELMDRSYSLLGQVLLGAQTVMVLVAAIRGGDVQGETVRLLAVCVLTIVITTVTVQRG